MWYRKSLWSVLVLISIAVFLTACGVNAKSGHWEGKNKTSVSFDVASDGKIRDLRIVISEPFGGCLSSTLWAKEIAVKNDGTFEYTAGLSQQFTVQPSTTVRGKFDTPTSATGIYKSERCGELRWNAEWKTP